ncbi:transcriptional regulator NrdR [Facklamia sp. HMSC062C11]|uniref:transcriptional regulator NrdR n=1 Tax=Facklamia TaxID=66831 RepID=UPI0008A2418C|nr:MULTISPECIES: transcriptional regulator NrdR [Facklamia]OFL66108.1 transcriptional regulator NrdR [Facklamia sp. HMSC062C11]PKY93438.1 transcriptional repressor NrdR [Facklamia hominis]
MECPKCHQSQLKVIDSRPDDSANAIRRRRECLACGYRFNTYERIERRPILVIKRDGMREEFNRDKLLRGIVRSAEKRPITGQQMEDLVNQVETQIIEQNQSEIESKQIGEYVMPLLLELDEVAYIRFASVYRKFQSKEMFIKELEALDTKKTESPTTPVELVKDEDE